MPAPNVAVPHSDFLDQCARHDKVIAGLPSVEAGLQKLLAELVMMRLFDEWQEAVAGVAYRLACGAPYVDGTIPNLLTGPATSTSNARTLFENHGRVKPRYVKWSRVNFINDTTKHVIDAADPFVSACSAYSLQIAEMQAIRNRIAHKNARSREAFQVVVRRYYGANLNHVSPGLLLLSPRQSPPLLHRYLATCRVIVRDCAKA